MVAGKPLIGWHLERLALAGIRDVVINLSWLGEMIAAALGDGGRYGPSNPVQSRTMAGAGNGGGLLQALPLLVEDPFLLVNGDVFTDIDFAALQIAAGDLAQLVLVPNPDHNQKGDFWLGERGPHPGRRR